MPTSGGGNALTVAGIGDGRHNNQNHHQQQPQLNVRPTSLNGPEKEPVNFAINLVGAPPEVEQLVEHIKNVAEQFLYHWKTFPIGEFFIIFLLNIFEF